LNSCILVQVPGSNSCFVFLCSQPELFFEQHRLHSSLCSQKDLNFSRGRKKKRDSIQNTNSVLTTPLHFALFGGRL
jgi:hypothetical protein